MKKILPLLLALTLVLSGCQGQQTAPGSSVSEPSPPTESSVSSEPQPGDAAVHREISPDAPMTDPVSDRASEKPKPESGGPGTLPYVHESSNTSSSPWSLPDTTPLVAKYTSTAPAKQSWTMAYDTFYSGIPKRNHQGTSIDNPFSDEAVIRGDLIFPIYFYEGLDTRDLLLRFIASAKKGEPYSDDWQVFNKQMGAVMECLDGSYFGEALGTIDTNTGKGTMELKLGQLVQYTEGDYCGRYSMTITEGVENQLLDREYDPATTTAHALWIGGYTTGTVFQDGEKCCFLNQTVGTPVHGVLESGRIYTMQELAADMETRIDELAPEGEPTPIPYNAKPNPDTAKPVIYLYPEEKLDISVKLDYQGTFTYTYPTYQNGWEVTAYPDGRLVNHRDNTEHYYLFWEGNKKIDWDQSQGFVVKGSDTESFLREKLTTLGLTAREMNDFITYWAPEMCRNDYNLVTFAYEQYEELAPLTVTPAPDTILRVHMVYRACAADTQVQAQELHPTERTGFTVVEWSGTRA